MTERSGDTKDTLLDELESIRGLLEDQDQIPVLNEVIESIEPLSQDRPRQATPLGPSATERPSARRRPSTPARASGDNPFLPEHIRARLHGNRPPPGVRTPEPAPQPAPEAEPSRTELIDEVIEASLPELRERLRGRLSALTDEQLRALLPPND